jgi:hypothetical protein
MSTLTANLLATAEGDCKELEKAVSLHPTSPYTSRNASTCSRVMLSRIDREIVKNSARGREHRDPGSSIGLFAS